MFLYNLTLEKPGAVTCCCYGSFTAPKQQEVVVGRGQYIELLKIGPTRQLLSVAVHEVFGVVRAVESFRLDGQTKDHLIVGSDSGRITILDFDNRRKAWVKVHQETFGRSGCRRAVAGQYLATDPRGRAVMIGAVEKQKFVYILSRDSEGKPAISSPLEAHKSHTVTYCCVGLDPGLANPIFASIEVDHGELDEDPSVDKADKELVFYELDLGLYHVVRKWSTPIDQSANHLVAVPGGDEGPGGVLVCSENYVTYMNMGHEPVRQVLPRRQDMLPESGLMVVSSVLCQPKKSTPPFFIIQSEYGDLYKVTLSTTSGRDEVRQVKVRYFDTVPVANGLAIFRSGYLYVGSEFGDHKLYQFLSLGDDSVADDAIVGVMTIAEDGAPDGQQEVLPLFNPRRLRNLAEIDQVTSMAPITDMKMLSAAAVAEDGGRMYTLCGRGAGSSIRVMQHGLNMKELAVAPLPGVPERVWTIRRKLRNQYDDYIVVSFVNATIVLSVGDSVEEVTDSGFWGATMTLTVRTMQDNSLLQVHRGGLRHIRKDSRISEWKAPGRKAIVRATANERQVVICLAGGDMVYFELDQYGAMNEVNKKSLQLEVLSVAVAPVPEGRVRSRFLSVGLEDKSVLLISLDPDDHLHTLARQQCNSEPDDLCMVEMQSESMEREQQTMLYIGLRNGILVRSVLDGLTGEISDTRTRFCGTRPCRLVPVVADGRVAVCVLSSRSWLAYTLQSRYHFSPLSTEAFEHVAPFASERCPEGVVTVRQNQVKILSFERFGETFNKKTIPLKATPRAFVEHPLYHQLIILETDHRAYTDADKQVLRHSLRESLVDEEDPESVKKVEEAHNLPEREYGTISAPQGRWRSYIRIWDPKTQETQDLIELEENQAAFSLTTVVFAETGGEVHLVVGTVKDLVPNPRAHSGGLLLTFRFKNEGRLLDLVHKTVITEGVPHAMHPFQGRLLVGVGSLLRLYQLGRRKLLRKCENRMLPNQIMRITSEGGRIFVGDSSQSVFFMRYKKSENLLTVFADDTQPRWVTDLCVLDHSTVAVADKFGNVSVLRLGSAVSEEIDNDPGSNDTAGKWLWDRGICNGAPQKCELVATTYVGSTVTSLQRAQLTPGGREVVVYATLGGGVGALLPVTSRRDVDMLRLLEMHLRQENPPLCGRDHLAYRSYYAPVKGVIDGDFCELFSTLSHSVQADVAGELGASPNEVKKRLEEIRSKVM